MSDSSDIQVNIQTGRSEESNREQMDGVQVEQVDVSQEEMDDGQTIGKKEHNGSAGTEGLEKQPEQVEETSSNPTDPDLGASQKEGQAVSEEASDAYADQEHSEKAEMSEIPAVSVDNGDHESEDPNTSSLPVPSQLLQFATPSKSLPPLKDIEPISTPKSFSVAKDNSNDVSHVASSPIAHNTGRVEIDENANNDEANVVSGFLNVDTQSLHSINNKDLVNILYKKSIEFQELRSENSLLQFNQEQANQIQQKKFKILQEKLNKINKSNAELSQTNESILVEKTASQQLISQLKDETNSLKDKVNQLEQNENKFTSDYSSLINTKDQEIYKVNESINGLTSSNIELSQKVNELTKEINVLRNDKFSLKLELTKASNETSYLKDQKKWYEDELKSVQSRFTDLLKKHESEYLITSNKLSSLTNKNETLQNLNKNQQELVNDLKSKLEQEISKFSSLDSKFEIEKIKFSNELKSKDELLELTKVQSDQRVERINQLESYIDEIKNKLGNSINKLQLELSEKTETVIALEEKLKRTEEVLDKELHKETELPKLSASSELIASQGISLSSLYSEFNHLKKQLVLERSQKERLANQLESFVNELESKKPAITSYRDQVKFYENSLKDMIGKVETIRTEKLGLEKDLNKVKSKVSDSENELVSMKKLCKDLGRQLCYYLIHSKIRDNNEEPLSINERRAIENILEKSGNKDNTKESDTDQLISQRLVSFTNIIELQQRNQDLLTAVRQLGKKLETKEEENINLQAAAIEEAKDAILTLEGELESLSIKLEAVTKERDILKSISESSGADSSKSEIKYLNDVNNDLKSKLSESEKVLKDLQSQSNATIKELNDKLREVTNSKNELTLKLSTMKHSVDLAETRFSNAQKSLENSRQEIEHIKNDIKFWKDQTSKQETLLINRSNELRDTESLIAKNEITIKNLEIEKELKNSVYETLKEDVSHLKADKEKLNEFVINLQSLLKDREQSNRDLSERLNKSIENYHSLQEKLNDKEERIMILSNQSELALKAQNTKLEQVGELSKRVLDSKNKLAEKESLVETLQKKIKEQTDLLNKPRTTSIQLDSKSDNEKTRLSIEYEQLREDLLIAEGQVNEFSNLAKAAEEALVDATDSFEDYKVESDSKYNTLLKEKSSLEDEITRLNQSLKDSQSEIESIKSQHTIELNELKSQLNNFSSKANAYDDLRKDYESKLNAVSNDLNIQVNLANDNQNKYHEELQKNQELTKQIALLKEEAETVKVNIRSLTNELESTKNLLDINEERFQEERQALQDQLDSSKAKLKDLQEQNSIILNQLELSKSTVNVDTSEDLREVVSYLRREKEAAEAKVNIVSEEHERLQQRVNQTLAELQATKSELLRARSISVDLDETTKEHNRLLEQLQQLNILRESNTTLRNENHAKAERIAELENELQGVISQLDPLQVKVNSLTADIEVKDQKIKLIQEENERIKVRSVSTEPEVEKEYETLKQKYNSIREKANTRIQAQNERIKELQTSITSLKEELVAAKESKSSETVPNAELEAANNKLKILKADSDKVISSLTQQKVALEKEISSLNNKISSLQSQKSDSSFEDQLNKLKNDFSKEKSELEKVLTNQFDNKLKEELQKASSSVNTEQIRSQIENEFKNKFDQLERSVEERKSVLENEYNKKLAQQLKIKVEEEIAKGNLSTDVAKIREDLTRSFANKITEKEKEFTEKLKTEREETEKQIVKKYELRLKLLNKKLEKLDKNNESSNSAPSTSGNSAASAGSSLPSIPPIPQVGQVPRPKPLGHQFTESTLTVHRPAVDRADSNEKKRPLNNQSQPSNKRPKE